MRYQRLPTQGPWLVQHKTAMAFFVCTPRPNSIQSNTVLQFRLIAYLLPKMHICHVTLLLKKSSWNHMPNIYALFTSPALSPPHNMSQAERIICLPLNPHTVLHLYTLRYISCASNGKTQCSLNCLVVRIT